ncbi:HNH endonuclease [Vibrio phage VPp1]|nr:HNH endonuclease [Vibrio phage VPp1]
MKKCLDAILSRTVVTQDGCLFWTGAINTDGYPRALIDGNNNAKLHRVVLELKTGKVPEVARHTCDNPLCLNPNHLVDGTQYDNMLDRDSRGRTHNHVSVKEKELVKSMRAEGKKYKEIAKALGISYKRVEYINLKY